MPGPRWGLLVPLPHRDGQKAPQCSGYSANPRPGPTGRRVPGGQRSLGQPPSPPGQHGSPSSVPPQDQDAVFQSPHPADTRWEPHFQNNFEPSALGSDSCKRPVLSHHQSPLSGTEAGGQTLILVRFSTIPMSTLALFRMMGKFKNRKTEKTQVDCDCTYQGSRGWGEG